MKTKRIIAAVCALLLMLTAVGCGKSANSADTEAVMAALDKFSACKSFTIVQVTECRETITIDKQAQVYDSRNELLLSLQTEPELQIMRSTTVSAESEGDLFEKSSISYIIPENGGYSEYIFDGYEWLKISAEDGSDLEGINAASITATFFADQLSYYKAGEEQLDGGMAARDNGTLDGDALINMLGGFGYLNSVASMSENQQAKVMENLLKDLKGVTVSVWVDKATGYPVRFETDMGDVLKDIEKSISKSLGNKSMNSQYTISGCTISMVAKDFDAVGEIVLPADAASAKPYDYEIS